MWAFPCDGENSKQHNVRLEKRGIRLFSKDYMDSEFEVILVIPRLAPGSAEGAGVNYLRDGVMAATSRVPLEWMWGDNFSSVTVIVPSVSVSGTTECIIEMSGTSENTSVPVRTLQWRYTVVLNRSEERLVDTMRLVDTFLHGVTSLALEPKERQGDKRARLESRVTSLALEPEEREGGNKKARLENTEAEEAESQKKMGKEESDEATPSQNESEPQSLQVLIIEDDRPTRKLLEAQGRREGYQVFGAADGNEALGIMQNQEIGAVFMDVILPDIMGDQLCSKLLRTSHTSQPPIIVAISGTNDPLRVASCINNGCVEFLVKPLKRQDMAMRINFAANMRHGFIGTLRATQPYLLEPKLLALRQMIQEKPQQSLAVRETLIRHSLALHDDKQVNDVLNMVAEFALHKDFYLLWLFMNQLQALVGQKEEARKDNAIEIEV